MYLPGCRWLYLVCWDDWWTYGHSRTLYLTHANVMLDDPPFWIYVWLDDQCMDFWVTVIITDCPWHHQAFLDYNLQELAMWCTTILDGCKLATYIWDLEIFDIHYGDLTMPLTWYSDKYLSYDWIKMGTNAHMLDTWTCAPQKPLLEIWEALGCVDL